MTLLSNLTITGAITAQVSGAVQIREGNPHSALIQANFNYGSGGTNATVWVQTSIDGGGSWIDVAAFQFTTASAKSIANLSAYTPVTTLYTPTDGSLTANTAKDGILGPLWRTKTTTTGTYAGGTTLRVDLVACGAKATSLT
jgi:hypothetical protein